MISLSYDCTCGWASPILDEAQEHANKTTHHVRVSGFITPNKIVVDKASIEEAARRRAYESAILRAARDKNLLRREE